jgi:hypothetical protein
MTELSMDKWVDDLIASSRDHDEAIDSIHTHLRNAGLLSQLTMHKYQCKRGCQIATVFKASGLILCAVRDYKYSPGLNQAESVPAAREKNTLNGDNHWPSQVYDVVRLSKFGNDASVSLVCRHHNGSVRASDMLSVVEGVTPGRPTKPTRL